MIIPEIKVNKEGDDIICSITYGDMNVKAGYFPDGTPFVISSGSAVDVANNFTRIGCKMWDAILDKFDMNPGCALEKGLITLKYCKQMQFAHIVGYDISNLTYNNQKSYRNIEEFYEEHLK